MAVSEVAPAAVPFPTLLTVIPKIQNMRAVEDHAPPQPPAQAVPAVAASGLTRVNAMCLSERALRRTVVMQRAEPALRAEAAGDPCA